MNPKKPEQKGDDPYLDRAYAIGARAGIREIADMENGSPLRPDYGPPMETGLSNLDYVIGGGLRVGQLVVIGARSGHGKSALAEQIALNVSKKYSTTYFGLELGYEGTCDRILAKYMNTDVRSVRALLKNPNEYLREHLDKLAFDHSLRIEQPLGNIEEPFCFSDMLDMIVANRPKLVVIDHLRHLDDWLAPARPGERGDLGTARMARRLVAVAQAYKCCVVAVHQAKNTLQNGRPSQHDLADTAALAQHAHHVWMIHRPFRGEGLDDKVAEIIVDKNREGPECLIHTEWSGRLMRYRDMLPSDEMEVECCKTMSRSEPAWRSPGR